MRGRRKRYNYSYLFRYLPPGSVRLGADVNFNSPNLYVQQCTTHILNINNTEIILVNYTFTDLNSGTLRCS